MLHLLSQLLEKLSQDAPNEGDLLNSSAFKLLVKNFPGLEKQIKLAWNGDIRAKGKHEPESSYLFPKVMQADNLVKFDSSFSPNQQSMRAVKELYDLFIEKFKIANKKQSWLSI